MFLIKSRLFSLCFVCSLALTSSPLIASALVLSEVDVAVGESQRGRTPEAPLVVDQELAHRLYDISQSLLFRLEDDLNLNTEFLDLLESDKPLGEFSEWMTSATRTVSKEEKIQKANNILGNTLSNYKAIQNYEDWIIGYSEGKHSAEQLFETFMTVYLAKSRDRVKGLFSGEPIPPTLEKHVRNLDQFSQGLAQQSIDTHTLLYLLLETLYDAIDITHLSPQAQDLLKHMPVLTSLLEGRSAVGPNPDLSLLDGAILFSGDYTSPRDMPRKLNFRGLRDDFKKSFLVLKAVTERQVIVKGRSTISLYSMSDFLPAYENALAVMPPLVEKKQSSKKKSNCKRKKKKGKARRVQTKAAQTSSVELKAEVKLLEEGQGAQEEEAVVVVETQEEGVVSTSLPLLSLEADEEAVSASVDLFESDGDEENTNPHANRQPTLSPLDIKPVVDLRPVLHQRRWNSLMSFWEDSSFSYQDFTTLFEGFGGEVKQTKGGSSHVKLFFTTPEGICLVNGTWRPHPKPILRGNSLKHLRFYFEQCGFMLENYQIAR